MERWIPVTLTLCAVFTGVGALEVTIPKAEYEFARGDNITLPCTFRPKVSPPSMAVITWSLEGTQAGAQETTILTHYYPAKTTDIKNVYEGRASVDIDVAKGRANLMLRSITLADNKIFECRVLIPRDDEGTLYATTRLVVLVAPSTPICKIQGKAEYGQNINLTCHSEEGSPPPEYSWQSFDVRNQPRSQVPGISNRGSIKPLLNISKETSGFYVCTSRNKIRAATCNLTLSVMPPSMNVGSTAGIIAGVVAFLIVLVVIVYCCCCRKKKEDKEYAMGVRKDEYHDNEADVNGESRPPEQEESTQNHENSEVRSAGDRRDRYEDKSERDYDDRRSDYDDRRSDYDDRGRRYDDRRSDYDDRRSDYTERRSDYDDRASDYDNRRERYDDDRRYEDERRYDDRRDRD